MLIHHAHLDAAPPQAALHVREPVPAQRGHLHLIATLLRQRRPRVEGQVAEAVQQRRQIAGEGVETVLGAGALIKHRYPVWSMVSTSGLIGFEVPMEVDWITGFPDGDKPWKKTNVGDDIVVAEPAGRVAMRRLAERVRALDKRFDTQPEPKMKQDYWNIWDAVRRLEAVS